ncbi:MAG: 30S ribosomal protein S6 [Candidatus Omnitrophica bacterium]|nr:30S ribosomal protein S6 [Candidatus Omnitrophota bacterium]
MSKNYEGLFIMRGDLDDGRVDAAFEELKGLIAKHGGTVSKVDKWGRRKLAYPIQKLKEGVYFIVYFAILPTQLLDLERALKLYENLLRFLIIKMEEGALAGAGTK